MIKRDPRDIIPIQERRIGDDYTTRARLVTPEVAKVLINTTTINYRGLDYRVDEGGVLNIHPDQRKEFHQAVINLIKILIEDEPGSPPKIKIQR